MEVKSSDITLRWVKKPTYLRSKDRLAFRRTGGDPRAADRNQLFPSRSCDEPLLASADEGCTVLLSKRRLCAARKRADGLHEQNDEQRGAVDSIDLAH